MTIVVSDERWLLPDGRLVGPVDVFELNDMQHLNGVAGLSELQVASRNIVKMQDRDKRWGDQLPNLQNPGQWLALSSEAAKQKLAEYAAEKRWQKEIAGITVGGAPVRTDRESQGLIAGAFQMVQDDPQKVIKFKTAGGFVDLDATMMGAIARAVGQHVQACFAAEASVVADIDSGAITTFEQVDDGFNS